MFSSANICFCWKLDWLKRPVNSWHHQSKNSAPMCGLFGRLIFLLTSYWLDFWQIFLKATEKKNTVHPEPIHTGAEQKMVPETQKQKPTTKWIRAFFILIKKILLYQMHNCFQYFFQSSSSWSDADIHTSRVCWCSKKKKRGQGIKILYLQNPDGPSKVIVIFNPIVNEREDKKI